MAALLRFKRPPIRYIELRATDRRRGLWQAYYAGDEWTAEFITTIGQRWLVEDGLRCLTACRGLPLVEMDHEPVEVAA